MRQLKAEKYDTWEWTYGRSPSFDMVNRDYFPGGRLEIGLSVSGGRLTAMQFYGDFLSITDTTPLAQALVGTDYREDAVAAVLAQYPLAAMFGGITGEELLRTIFNG